MSPDAPLSASEALALLIPAAREAGEIGLRFAREGARVFTKADASPVTEADLAIDAHLALRLRAVSPDIGWLSEEVADTADRLARRQVWIVDPIDGTKGFVAGNGEWVVSAALVSDGRPLAGVLFRPTTGDLYEASRGGGAFLNGARLAASDGRVADLGHIAAPKPAFEALRPLAPGAIRDPRLASLALRLAQVAEGRIDAAFASPNSNDWDIAAADLIVEEAGGSLTWSDGSRIVYNRPEPVHRALIAAGRQRHAALVALLGPDTARPSA